MLETIPTPELVVNHSNDHVQVYGVERPDFTAPNEARSADWQASVKNRLLAVEISIIELDSSQ